jgi:hypothetical protein
LLTITNVQVMRRANLDLLPSILSAVLGDGREGGG